MLTQGHPSDWASLLTRHSDAVDDFCRAAGRLADPRWLRPIAPGKWTPAEITSHVSQAYRVVRDELAGQAGMRLLGSRFQRFVLRHTLLPRLLAGQPFPRGVRAPRETRPQEVAADPVQALFTLRESARSLADELSARAGAGTACLTHAYFGPLSARQGIRLLTMHTRHHARQLEGVARQ